MKGIAWLQALPFIGFHLALLATPFFWPTPGLLLLCFASYLIRMFGITAGFHRYFSHRSYKLNRFNQFLLAFLGGTAFQKGALWWAAHHRSHHRNADTANDVHSPLNGFWQSHCLWFLTNKYDATEWSRIRDLERFSELCFLDRYHWLPGILFGAVIIVFFGLPGLFWGFGVSTVLLWHGTFCINSLGHIFGRRRFNTADASRNSLFLALITLGEGWHNNHHRFMNSARQGFLWWEIDVTYYLLRLCERIKLVRDLKEPPIELKKETSYA
jgi:stearoyl-CoA desaturase (delta-9 desaturase)